VKLCLAPRKDSREYSENPEWTEGETNVFAYAVLPSLSCLVALAPFLPSSEATFSASPFSMACSRRSSFLFHSLVCGAEGRGRVSEQHWPRPCWPKGPQNSGSIPRSNQNLSHIDNFKNTFSFTMRIPNKAGFPKENINSSVKHWWSADLDKVTPFN
jgi:hypothetical protein